MKNIFILAALLALSGLHCAKDADAVDTGGSKAGSTASQVIYNGYMYVLDEAKLRVLSLTDPAHPTEIASLTVDGGSQTIYPYRQNLILGSANGASIIDISDPAKPKVSGSLPQFRAEDPIVVKGDTAFQTRHWGTEEGPHQGNLHVLSVANPNAPFELTQYPLLFPLGLDYKDNILYVCNGNAGLDVIDISQALSPKKLRTIDAIYMSDCIVQGEMLVVTGKDGIAIFNIADAAHPVLNKIFH